MRVPSSTLLLAVTLAVPFALNLRWPAPPFANIPVEIGEASSTELPLTDNQDEAPPVVGMPQIERRWQQRGSAGQ